MLALHFQVNVGQRLQEYVGESVCVVLLAGSGCGLDQGKPSRPREAQEQWLFSAATAIAGSVLCFAPLSEAVKCELHY